MIDEPLGGAHRDHHQMAARLKMYLVKTLRELVDQPTDKLLAARYDKFRRMGQFLEPGAPPPTAPHKAATARRGLHPDGPTVDTNLGNASSGL